MAGLALATTRPVSQLFGGAFSAEPTGWVKYGANGRPLKAYGSKFPGAVFKNDLHKGIDQYGPLGSDLKALEAGKVVAVDKVLGNITIQIRGQANSRYLLGHCEKELVAVGDTVSRGQHIGEMGDEGHAKGVHVHTGLMFREKGSDGVTRWIWYDLARFVPAGSLKMGIYSSVGVKPGELVPGGDMIYDDRIYPIRSVTINDGVNIRKLPDTKAEVLVTTKAPTPATQLNEVLGGDYTSDGVKDLWAKVRVAIKGVPTVAFVAKPLITV